MVYLSDQPLLASIDGKRIAVFYIEPNSRFHIVRIAGTTDQYRVVHELQLLPICSDEQTADGLSPSQTKT